MLPQLPLIGTVRRQLHSPVRRAFSVDRLPFEQYTDPPGDPGLFGPGSVTWRVHADPSMVVGGISALLLQTLHPLAMAGVADHSTYREDPFGRLGRTASFVTGTTYGSTEVAEKMIDVVRAVHRKVRGTAPDGRPYSADDPELITYVHATEVLSFLRAHQRFVPLPVWGEQADRYIHEMAVIAERLGGTGIPRSRVELRAYFRDIRPELAVGEQAREAVRFLISPLRDVPNPLVTVAHQLVVQAAIGLLPTWGRELLGLRQPTFVDLAMVRPATHLIMGTLRLTGGTPPPIVEARRRCATEPGAARAA